MSSEQIIKTMKERGYYLHSSAKGRIDFAKDIVDGLSIYAIVALDSPLLTLQIYFDWYNLHVSTAAIDFNHPFFESFESQIEKAALMLNERSTEEWSYHGNKEQK